MLVVVEHVQSVAGYLPTGYIAQGLQEFPFGVHALHAGDHGCNHPAEDQFVSFEFVGAGNAVATARTTDVLICWVEDQIGFLLG
jgi:hypothetical protein